ncbi:sialate O-acetylesterase [Planctomycetota bacterium]
MVLQSDSAGPIWGWAQADQKVTVTFGDFEKTVQVDSTGLWRTTLPSMQASKQSHKLQITAGNEKVQFTDILVGEVWFCSGQSNMGFALKSDRNFSRAAVGTKLPYLRYCEVEKQIEAFPVERVGTKWTVSSPETTPRYSAVAFYFGRELQDKLDVPIGIIHCSWGGTPIEAWMPREAFHPGREGLVHDYKWLQAREREYYQKVKTASEKWLQQNDENARGERWLTNPTPWPQHLITENPKYPTVLYNGMVHPIIPFRIRGVLWYQGESNVKVWNRYYDLMDAWISIWKQRWGISDLPFYYVQIAPWNIYKEDNLPRLREAQLQILRDIENTGMAVIHDTVNNLNNIHPNDKQPVAHRLALWALAQTYGRDIVYSGPLYRDYSIEGDRIRINFDHAKGLQTNDGKVPDSFVIAGEDKKFMPAEANIDGETIILHSSKVSRPTAARFAWSKTAQPNLINAANLPASPFRTDNGL